MGNTCRFLKGLIASFFCANPWVAMAQDPTLTKHQVNGYEVYIINTHIGNSVSLTVNVQTGAKHDEPKALAGRAHLWEHWIHGGSKKYPGHTTHFSNMGTIGGRYNAYTAEGKTFYHWTGHRDGYDEAADYLGAMLTSPEWNFETFQSELATVKNEAGQYQTRDDYALGDSMDIHLTPQNHPFQMFHVGTQKQLDEMNPLSLKALFYSNYRPGSMQIIVAANLDLQDDGRPGVTKNDLLRTVRANFPKFSVPADPDLHALLTPPSKTIVFPSIIGKPGALNYLELGSPTENRSLELVFESVPGLDYANTETLLDYINLPSQGSLSFQLREKKWINSFGASRKRLNNLELVNVYFDLTEEGALHRHEVVSAFLNCIQDIKTRGLRADILKQLVQRNIFSYQDLTREPYDAAERLANFLDYRELSPQLAFRHQDLYQRATVEGAQQVARQAFDVNRMQVGYLGNDVQSSTMEPTFNRPMRLVTDKRILRAWQASLRDGGTFGQMYDVKISDIDVKFSLEPIKADKQPARLLDTGLAGVRAALQENHSAPIGAMSLEFQLPHASLSEFTAFQLVVAAFSLRYKTEEFYFNSLKTPFFQHGSPVNHLFQASGNAGAVPEIIAWGLEAFSKFVPTIQELAIAREKTIDGILRGKDAMSAMVARSALLPLIKGPQFFSDHEVLDELKTIDLSSLAERTRLRLNTADIEIIAAGDFQESDVKQVIALTSKIVSSRLTEEQKRVRSKPFPNQRASVAFWTQLAENKEETQYGWARAYAGPPVYSREHAAYAILDEVLSQAIFAHNRIEQKLGYVHRSFYSPTHQGLRPVLFGQTDGIENLGRMESGWEYVLAKVFDGTLSEDNFEGVRQALIRDATTLPFHPRDDLQRMMRSLNYTPNPNASREWIAHLRDVTPEEIYAVGRRVFQGQPTLDVFASRTKPAYQACEQAFETAGDVRGALLK